MQSKVENVGVGAHFTFEGQQLVIFPDGPTMDGMIFAKRVEPNSRLTPAGWWRAIPCGTLVELEES